MGNTISNLTVNITNIDAGLFGYSEGTIRNIGILGGSVTAGADAGGLIGYNNGVITNAFSTATVSGVNYIGGLAGGNGGTITRSFANGAVTGTGQDIGGLVGENDVATIKAIPTRRGSGQGQQRSRRLGRI